MEDRNCLSCAYSGREEDANDLVCDLKNIIVDANEVCENYSDNDGRCPHNRQIECDPSSAKCESCDQARSHIDDIFGVTKIKALENRLQQAEIDNAVLLRKIESLTPGGSEFHNDPDKCIQFARDRMDGVKRIKELEADNAHVVKYAQDLCDWVEIWATGWPDVDEENLEAMFGSAQQLKHVLSQSGHGTALLKELEGLRRVREVAEDIVRHEHTNLHKLKQALTDMEKE